MLIFALDTATLQGSYGWVKTEGSAPKSPISTYATLFAPAAPGHAETVLCRTQEVLSFGGYELKDIDLLVFGRGPGTFTGIRIGLSTVKGIALACNKPIIGISSLEAVALSAGYSGLTAVLLDARRGELFAALYEVTVGADGWPRTTPVIDEWVGKAAAVIERLAETAAASTVHVTGNGILPYRDMITESLNAAVLPETAWSPCPFWMGRIGHMRYQFKGADDLASVEPIYLREPDARLPSVKQR